MNRLPPEAGSEPSAVLQPPKEQPPIRGGCSRHKPASRLDRTARSPAADSRCQWAERGPDREVDVAQF